MRQNLYQQFLTTKKYEKCSKHSDENEHFIYGIAHKEVTKGKNKYYYIQGRDQQNSNEILSFEVINKNYGYPTLAI